MNILVTGAAGYIGSVLTEKLLSEGHFVIALDNLERGHKEAVHKDAFFVLGDIGNKKKLTQLFLEHNIDAVMHLAAHCQVGESMTNPEKYFHTNVISAINLLSVMIKHKVNKLIFSSTAAVYGNPVRSPVRETDSTCPVNPYGESKLIFERILHWYGIAYGLNFISLRYFNAAGASERYGCDHENETLLIPKVLKVALGQEKCVMVWGDDYSTRDGSGIRDYIDVRDIATAHVLALRHLGKKKANKAYNLGNGKGYSVFEVIETARKVTGTDIPTIIKSRRPGDPPVLVAISRQAKMELGWEPTYNKVEFIIESAWKWQNKHPHGY